MLKSNHSMLLKEAVPFFQPIVSLHTKKVAGYEALGRRVVAGEVLSLGAFFQDKTISVNEHLLVDRHLRELAMRSFKKQSDLNTMLFLNINPSWIYRKWMLGEPLPTLELLKKENIDGSRVVIEITEHAFDGDLKHFMEMIDLYRACGCKIAVDDVGSGLNHFDRIAWIQPDILKIDLKLLKKSRLHWVYEALLRSYSVMASNIGASLLVEGVEDERDFRQALALGARYVQGFFFAPALESCTKIDSYEEQLSQQIHSFSQLSKHHWEARIKRESDCQNHLSFLIHQQCAIYDDRYPDEWIVELIQKVPKEVKRVYICKENGEQLSMNFFRDSSGSWRQDPQMKGTNWSWRPYFIPSVIRMKQSQQGFLSEQYIDLETSLQMQTFCYPLNSNTFIFMDMTFG